MNRRKQLLFSRLLAGAFIFALLLVVFLVEPIVVFRGNSLIGLEERRTLDIVGEVQKPSGSPHVAPATDKWTIMIYLDADNNLEDAGIEDLNELERGLGLSEDVTILVLMDRIPEYDDTNGDWTGTRLYRVVSDSTDTIASLLLEDKGELNMGDPATLTDFISYCFANFPADHFLLVLWDHGAGIDGICFDDSDGDFLTVDEVQSAISASESAHSEKISLLCHDACLMNMIEVAYEFRDVTDYFVASEETVPWDGFDYEDILTRLVVNSSITPREFAQEIVFSYKACYNETEFTTLSAIDSSAISAIIPYINDFAENLSLAVLANHTYAIVNARAEPAVFSLYMSPDFISFIKNLLANGTLMGLYPELELSAATLLDQLNASIIANYQQVDSNGYYNGLSIFLPLHYDYYQEEIAYYQSSTGPYSGLDWLTDSIWSNFLTVLYSSNYTGYEYNETDWFYNATELELAVPTALTTIADRQVYSLTITEVDIYQIDCTVFSGDVDLCFETMEGEVIGWSYLYNPDDGSMEQIRDIITPGEYYLWVRNFGGENSTYILEANKYSPIALTLETPVTATSGTMGGDYFGHYSQTLYHFYSITCTTVGEYTFNLTSSMEADFDLAILDANYNVLAENYYEGLGGTEEISITINYPTTLIICVHGFEGYGSFTLEAFMSSSTEPPTESPTSTKTSGIIPAFSSVTVFLGLLALTGAIILYRRK